MDKPDGYVDFSPLDTPLFPDSCTESPLLNTVRIFSEKIEEALSLRVDGVEQTGFEQTVDCLLYRQGGTTTSEDWRNGIIVTQKELAKVIEVPIKNHLIAVDKFACAVTEPNLHSAQKALSLSVPGFRPCVSILTGSTEGLDPLVDMQHYLNLASGKTPRVEIEQEWPILENMTQEQLRKYLMDNPHICADVVVPPMQNPISVFDMFATLRANKMAEAVAHQAHLTYLNAYFAFRRRTNARPLVSRNKREGYFIGASAEAGAVRGGKFSLTHVSRWKKALDNVHKLKPATAIHPAPAPLLGLEIDNA